MKDAAFSMFYGFSSDASMKDKNIIATLKHLSEDDSIVIIKPDKGNGIVILNKNDYLSKIETILQDSTKFKRLTDDWFKIII